MTRPVANDMDPETYSGVEIELTPTANQTINSVEIVTGPANGTASVYNLQNFLYQSNVGFFGTDSFTFKVISNGGTSNSATCAVTVLLAGQHGDPNRLVPPFDGGP